MNRLFIMNKKSHNEMFYNSYVFSSSIIRENVIFDIFYFYYIVCIKIKIFI